MPNKPTLMLLSAAALLLTATPTFAQGLVPCERESTPSTNACDQLAGRDVNVMASSLNPRLDRAQHDLDAMLDAETSSCQLPAPDAVATLARRLSRIYTQADDMHANLPWVTSDEFVFQAIQATLADESIAQDAQQRLDQAANQLPDSCSTG